MKAQTGRVSHKSMVHLCLCTPFSKFTLPATVSHFSGLRIAVVPSVRVQTRWWLLKLLLIWHLSIDRFHCHVTKKWIGIRPVEEAKKMKCYKRLTYKQFVQVSGLFGPQFLSYLPKRSTHLCRALYGDDIYWCTVLVHQYMAAGNQQNHLEFTFSIKARSFHSRTSIRVHKHIF